MNPTLYGILIVGVLVSMICFYIAFQTHRQNKRLERMGEQQARRMLREDEYESDAD